MSDPAQSVDQLYFNAEQLSQDFSLFPRKEPAAVIKGLLTERQINAQVERLQAMEVDEYIASSVAPTEESGRPGAKAIVRALNVPLVNEISQGPFYSCELTLNFSTGPRKIGVIAQDRAAASGVWGPEHHELAAQRASSYAIRSLPILTLMDTPGADPYEEANANNQAHSISRLIAELCNVDVPTLGIIIGQGYSGGAIPLAASNLLLSCRTGVFNTIHPRSLANLVRRYNLSWQECAKFVGVSSYELYKQGNIDGIVDYDPGETATVENFYAAIVNGIESIENGARNFVAEHPELLDHYHRNIRRYLNPTPYLSAVNASSTLKLRTSPTEYPNVFGVAYRYLRYLGLRSRIKATTTTQYGRLVDAEIPPGELAERVHRERRSAFLSWLQDPDKILYEDHLSKAWKTFQERRQRLGEEQGAIRTFLFGEPKENYDRAKLDLTLEIGLHLYNRWKASAKDNLLALVEYLRDYENASALLSTKDIRDVKSLLRSLSNDSSPFVQRLKSMFSFEGRKLFDAGYIDQKNVDFLKSELASELNLIMEASPLIGGDASAGLTLSQATINLINESQSQSSFIRANRRILEEVLFNQIEPHRALVTTADHQDMSVVDILLDAEVQPQFIEECQQLLVFSEVYDALISDLVAIAREAQSSRALQKETLNRILDGAISKLASTPLFENQSAEQINRRFVDWSLRLSEHGNGSNFLRQVEEWMRGVHKDKSDTLFVVLSHLFERVMPEFQGAIASGKPFSGRLEPARIGRRKDFWNRLNIAYRDLLFNEILTREKRAKHTTIETITAAFIDEFVEMDASLMSANPVSFPTFRPSIESALKADVRPHGLITGIGEFKGSEKRYRAGFVVSNVAFQAGSIDNSDCVRFCKLLVECAVHRLPVICFISSGGMQTKEGAAALFTMAVVNDRITRFVRDNDLPIIMFGYGDCTGGAQASFVTHPLVQTYYFSGASMPFAGQAVVERNLPFTCLMSNYLSSKEGAMQGLVQHPFAPNLDTELRKVDPEIPVPVETIVQVVDRIMAGRLEGDAPERVNDVVHQDADVIRPVSKVLVHARGCTAVKLVSKSLEHGLDVVLVQSDPDIDSVPADLVRAAGARGTVVPIGGNTSDESYLNALSILNIAQSQGVDALHPGIGFLSETPNFAALVRQKNINFVGPKVMSMETMGNKSNAISATMSIGVPVVPGSHGIVDSSERALEIAEQVGYPILLKAVHGGGGKGIVRVERAEQLHQLFHQVTTEARSAFGNGDVYIEKCVTSLRHIEAQVLRDTHGNTRVLGLRDCSVQRNNQKLLEESGSTLLSEALRNEVFQCAASIADAVDYIGAGTVEFIFDVPSQAIYFMEMNTRLQVEHPVTEATTGIDIVAQQFRIASGESIEALAPSETGYAIEARINAERASRDALGNVTFQPTPGKITRCELPDREGITLISMAAADKMVSPFYDSLIIQVIAEGVDRNDAVNNLATYLDDVVIEGINTNISLIKRILRDDVFLGGDYDTTYLPGFLSRTDVPSLIQEIDEAAGSRASDLTLEALTIEDSGEIRVLAPSTGVFYRAPSPSEPEYVNLGDVVAVDDVLCVLEAMKMFAPFRLSSYAGSSGELYPSNQKYRITRINVSSGQAVNEGDLLFVVEPVAA